MKGLKEVLLEWAESEAERYAAALAALPPTANDVTRRSYSAKEQVFREVIAKIKSIGRFPHPQLIILISNLSLYNSIKALAQPLPTAP